MYVATTVLNNPNSTLPLEAKKPPRLSSLTGVVFCWKMSNEQGRDPLRDEMLAASLMSSQRYWTTVPLRAH